MKTAISIALIVGGVALLYFGGTSFHSVSNGVSRLSTIALIAGGMVAMLAGLIGVSMPGKRR